MLSSWVIFKLHIPVVADGGCLKAQIARFVKFMLPYKLISFSMTYQRQGETTTKMQHYTVYSYVYIQYVYCKFPSV